MLATTPSGAVVSGWVQNEGSGNALLTAARGSSGAFGPPREVAPASTGAIIPKTVATGAGEVVVTFLATGSRIGWGARTGRLQAVRLRPDGTRLVGRALSLGAPGERTRDMALAADASGAWVAWTARASGAPRIRTQRLARGRILGRAQTISGTDLISAVTPSAPSLAVLQAERRSSPTPVATTACAT